jgi:benzoyl-CoA reductase subunit B
MGPVNIYKVMADTFSSINAHIGKKYPERKWAYEPSEVHWKEVYEAKESGKPVAWFNFGVMPEIFIAMDIVPQQIENITATAASFPEAKWTECVDIGQQSVPDYLCVAHKGALGAIEGGYLPKPEIIVGSSHPCDSSRVAHSMIAGHFKIPYFAIDIPYWDGEPAYQYVAGQIEKMVEFLEEATKKKLDLDKLRQVIMYSNEALRYIYKVRDLRRLIPCPTGGSDLLLDAGVNTNMSGTREAVEYFKMRYITAQEKVDKKEGFIKDEKLRIGYMYTPTFFNPGILNWLATEHKAVVVTDMMDYRLYDTIEDLSDIKKIYYGLAKKCILLPMAMHFRGPASYFTDFVVKSCRDYKVDAAIFTGGIACRSAWATAKLAKDLLRDELNIPMLGIEADVGDARIVSDEEMKNKMEDFLSVIMKQ